MVEKATAALTSKLRRRRVDMRMWRTGPTGAAPERPEACTRGAGAAPERADAPDATRAPTFLAAQSWTGQLGIGTESVRMTSTGKPKAAQGTDED